MKARIPKHREFIIDFPQDVPAEKANEGWDKLMAKKGRWRVPERTLLLIAALGGSLGSILGMEVFHHKTRHKKFSWGLPAIFLLQCVLVALVFSQF